MKKSWYGLAAGCVLVALTTACTSSQPRVVETRVVKNVGAGSLGNIELHTAELADELFARLNPNKPFRYAVVGFVPVSSMKFDSRHQHPLMMLGHQLEQGLITEAVNRGFVARDFKATDDIVIGKEADRVFSRDVTELGGANEVDFFISGTITEQQEGAVVNARVIHVKSKDVVAAATKFFPAGLFWQRERVTTRNGRLYRAGS